MNRQSEAPLYEALLRLRENRIVPFDVPGHKRGRGSPELTAFLGEACMSVDVNSMKPLDNLCHPTGVIREAEALAAEAFGAAHAFFMVGGTTSSVQAMVLSSVKRGDRIILPRNVHQSVINALVLCGAVPVYVNPRTDRRLGISLGMSVRDVAAAIDAHPDAKAVLVNNPTYYGICSDIRSIVSLAHSRGMRVLADEAHGTHFYFGEHMPVSAMAAGADMASVSMHKSGGSLTQSSLLLCGGGVNPDYVRQIINLTQTTSGSYLLLSSLDLSRRNLALRGPEIFAKVSRFAQYAREEINAIGDYYAYSRELVNGDSIFDFDETKLSVNTLDLGLAGIEVYDLLRDEYDIQIEFGDLGNILAYISVGDKTKNIERLISALGEIRRLYRRERVGMLESEYIAPCVELSPQEAFYAEKTSLPLEECEDRVSCEFVMCYPPGIPIVAPGERVTGQIIRYIRYAREKGCVITGPECMDSSRLNVWKGSRE
ncbi:MAG: aminotransferase class I/II-fold pyridoxal phosphate-dependent enzyme [Eubacteriales bacterium]|nr:aminotransferase class I/II-fold pyridoxal phosphate-dependent enzyme [Clostridiales bacterium]MDY3072584.1 aminotransferase class I/II-fold pyridoxal phosphate-dependent enzyme [Eubacteriales bacterium]